MAIELFQCGPMKYFQYLTLFNILIKIYNDGVERIGTKLTSYTRLVKGAGLEQE